MIWKHSGSTHRLLLPETSHLLFFQLTRNQQAFYPDWWGPVDYEFLSFDLHSVCLLLRDLSEPDYLRALSKVPVSWRCLVTHSVSGPISRTLILLWQIDLWFWGASQQLTAGTHNDVSVSKLYCISCASSFEFFPNVVLLLWAQYSVLVLKIFSGYLCLGSRHYLTFCRNLNWNGRPNRFRLPSSLVPISWIVICVFSDSAEKGTELGLYFWKIFCKFVSSGSSEMNEMSNCDYV